MTIESKQETFIQMDEISSLSYDMAVKLPPGSQIKVGSFIFTKLGNIIPTFQYEQVLDNGSHFTYTFVPLPK